MDQPQSENLFSAVVEQAEAGLRADVFVTSKIAMVPSRTLAAKLIAQGDVLVNGKKCKPSSKLEVADTVVANLSAFMPKELQQPQAEQIPLEVLYEDEHVLVINKPAGLTVHPGAGNKTGTLVNAVLAHCRHSVPSLGGPERAGIVHRLDKNTSGVMVVAKTVLALTQLSKQFASHSQERIYYCIANGTPPQQQGFIETWHGRDDKNRLKFATQQPGVGKIAKLHYEVVDSFLEGSCSLIKCQLYTGRTHQIRVQLEHIGNALLGDPTYGHGSQRISKWKELWATIKINCVRQMLHAYSLKFQHPASGEVLMFSVNPPQDFAFVLQSIRNCSSLKE